jgi:fucose permease
VAQAIVTSTVFQTANPDYATFVNNVYTNVMGLAPTPTQASPYITALATNATTETALLNAAAHLASFQQTIGLVGVAPATTGVLAGSGIDFIPA